MEYMVESRWTGWWGGYGGEGDIGKLLNIRAGEGWRLVRTETQHFLWFFFLPRVKLLLVWERQRQATATT